MAISDDQFIAAWREGGYSPSATSRILGMHLRTVHARANTIRGRGIDLPVLSQNPAYFRPAWTYPREMRLHIPDGVVLVASDLHMWPESHQPRPAIQQVFLDLAHELRPTAVLLAGDVIDGTRISRHGAIRGQATPSVAEEVDALAAYLREMPAVEHRHVTLGNHDLRVDNYLAHHANEMADWAGRLQDRTDGWDYSYSVVVNDNIEVRHDWRGGIHAAWNNTLHAGLTMLTGHTHQLSMTAHPDRRGVRYGIECGMLNDPLGPQWEYTHGRPNRWRAGFVVLSFDDGRLLPPELADMQDGRVVFRGKVLNKPRFRVKAGVT